jgi:hypothetical protein
MKMPLQKKNKPVAERPLSQVPFIPTGDDAFGEMTSASYEMPRMKLLHGVSPEVTGKLPNAEAGVFWHAALNENMGDTVRVILVRQTPYMALLDPGTGKVLARSTVQGEWLDGAANQTFNVEIGRKATQWHTKSNLAESGLAAQGTSGGFWGAATPAFDVVMWLEDEKYKMPVLYTFKKTAARPLRELFTILDMRKNAGVPRHAQMFDLKVRQVQGKEAAYYVPSFVGAGIIRDAAHVEFLQGLARQLAGVSIKVVGDDDGPDAAMVKPQEPAYTDEERPY